MAGIHDDGTNIGFKVYGLTNPDGTPLNIAGIHSSSSVMESHHAAREYNGRHVILNRVFRPETGRYEFAEEIWDISGWEAMFGATPDPSLNNVFEPVYVEEIELDETTVAIGQSATVGRRVLPQDADVRMLTWGIDDESIATVDSIGRVTGVSAGTATITATAVDGSEVFGTAMVTVMNAERWLLHWDFRSSPAGWSTGDTVTVQPTDADIGYGMTLLSSTGNPAIPTAASSPYGNGVQMVIDPNAAAHPFVGDFPFTQGRMRLNTGTFARIDDIQGPYTIVINFHAANNAAVDRFPVVRIGEVTHNLAGSDGHVPSATGGAASQLRVEYNGTDSPVIYLMINGGARIWDVYIEGFREVP